MNYGTGNVFYLRQSSFLLHMQKQRSHSLDGNRMRALRNIM